MTEVPEIKPDTTPVVETPAIVGLPLVQIPKGAVDASVVVEPTQTESAPVITPAIGEGLTVIAYLAVALPQVFVNVYTIVSMPAEIPVTTPVGETVAMPVDTLLQLIVPETEVSASVMLAPGHTESGPEITPAFGSGFTVTRVVVVAVPQVVARE